MLLNKAMADLLVTTKPVEPGTVVGEMKISLSPRAVIWTWDASDWSGTPIAPILYSANPDSNLVSDCLGQLCINTSNNTLYRSTAANSTTWALITTGAGGH